MTPPDPPTLDQLAARLRRLTATRFAEQMTPIVAWPGEQEHP